MRNGPLFHESVPDLIHAMLRASEVSMRAGQTRPSPLVLSAGSDADVVWVNPPFNRGTEEDLGLTSLELSTRNSRRWHQQRETGVGSVWTLAGERGSRPKGDAVQSYGPSGHS